MEYGCADGYPMSCANGAARMAGERRAERRPGDEPRGYRSGPPQARNCDHDGCRSARNGRIAEPLEPPGSRHPTLKGVARAAGLSRATVSREINKIRNVDPAITPGRDQGGPGHRVHVNQAARSLVTGRTGTMALVISEVAHRDPGDPTSHFLADPFFGWVVAGLSSAFGPAEVRLTLIFAESDPARAQLMDDLHSGRCDGAAVVSLYPLNPLPELLSKVEMLAVLFGHPAPDVSLSYVDLDNRARGWLPSG